MKPIVVAALSTVLLVILLVGFGVAFAVAWLDDEMQRLADAAVLR